MSTDVASPSALRELLEALLVAHHEWVRSGDLPPKDADALEATLDDVTERAWRALGKSPCCICGRGIDPAHDICEDPGCLSQVPELPEGGAA